MTKKLFRQIRNEWRGNLWLALELLVVSVVMWYIADLFYARLATRMETRGFDTSHCYLISMGELTDKSPDYKPYTDDEARAADVYAMLDRIAHYPGVEAASLSQNSYPYNGSNSDITVSYDTLQGVSGGIRRFVTPSFVQVFRYRGANGETPDQLADMLERGDFLASDNLFTRQGIDHLTQFNGRGGFHLDITDSTMAWRLSADLVPMHYCDLPRSRLLPYHSHQHRLSAPPTDKCSPAS